MLRDYQEKAISLIREEFKKGNKKVLLQMATGGGKTATFCAMLAKATSDGKKSIMLVRRRALVDQAHKRVMRENINHGVMMSGHWLNSPLSPVQICSVDTMRARQIFPEADLVIVDECFTPDMEILTEKGFIRFDQYTGDLKVAQFDSTNKKISFINPLRIIKKHIENKKIITLKSDKKFDFSATENHDILIERDNSLIKVKLKDLKNGQNKIYMTGHGSGKEKDLSFMEKFWIAFQADGSIHTEKLAYFTFSKQRKIDAFLSLMKEGNFNFSEISCGKGSSNNVMPRRRFSVKCDFNLSKKVYNYFKIENLSSEKCKKIIEYMVMWDGHILKNGSYYYSNTDKKAVDFYQSICCLAGYGSRITIQVDNRSVKFNDIHRLWVMKNKIKNTLQGVKRDESNYTGFVYCVSVPSGNIVVRRNGKVAILGNCHDATSKTYKDILSKYPDSYVVGVTATPYTADSLNHLADVVVKPISMKELMDKGYLVPPIYYAPTTPNLSSVRTDYKTKDYVTADLESVLNGNDIVGNLVENWIKYGENRPTLVSAVSVKHSMHIVDMYNKAGIKAEHCDATFSDQQRAEILKRHESGETKIITQVNIFSVGVDMPWLGCIQMARPTMSYIFFIQLLGRGTRPFPGKSNFIVLDNAGNTLRHGFITDEPEVDLNGYKKRSEAAAPIKTCKKCFAVYALHSKECPQCGYVNPVADRSDSMVSEAEGELIRVEELPIEAKAYQRVQQLKRVKKDIRFNKKMWIYNVILHEFGEEIARKYA